MGSDRVQLPHETDRVFLTDGGTETWLMHKRGLELPHFSSFHLLKRRAGSESVRAYDRAFADIAVEHGTAFIFDGLTYRASRDWGDLRRDARVGRRRSRDGPLAQHESGGHRHRLCVRVRRAAVSRLLHAGEGPPPGHWGDAAAGDRGRGRGDGRFGSVLAGQLRSPA